MQTTLKVDGMTCGGCVQNVTNLLSGVAGVEAVDVSLDAGQAKVDHDDSVATDQLISAVEAGGFDAAAA